MPKVWRDDGMLRVPTIAADLQECTLCDLKHCHQTVAERIEHGEPLHSVDKPRIFERVFYASAERLIGRPFHVFELQDTEGSPFGYPHRQLIHIAGMVRHLAIKSMEKNSPRGVDGNWVESFVAGHRREDETIPHRQLAYLPLQSVGHQHTDPSVRRVMIAAPLGNDEWLDHVARRLAGQSLEPLRGNEFLGDPPILVPVQDQKVVRFYVGPASVWHSITPVILPGHDDHKPDKTRKLIEKALAQSGVDQPCTFEWSAFSRFPKAYSAHKYGRNKRPQGYIRPAHLLSQTAVHLTLKFRDGLKVPGPLMIGAGRYCGFGLFAAEAAT